jgi:hypothetical protein
VLKLIFRTAVFGPIDLDYDRQVIRVGRSVDNDLVLPHPSVQPYHCLLVFRGEKVLCLPPDAPVPSEADLERLVGPEYGSGETLSIGELQFGLAHSSRTVAVHGASPGDLAAETGGSEQAGPQHYYCPHCRTFVQDVQIKRMGLVGRSKRNLCPKCSRLLEIRPGQSAPNVAT